MIPPARIPLHRFIPPLAAITCFASCQTAALPTPPGPVADAPAITAATTFRQSAPLIAAQSCDGTHLPPKPLSLVAQAIAPGTPMISGPARLSGAWHLTSDDPAFGGLSGLDILPGGALLAISDDGAFVQINRAEGTPDGTGSIAYMLGANGRMLSGKGRGDAEGLALSHGLAFVSFEHAHRITAFDIAGCGASARSIPVAILPGTFDDRSIAPNRGAEGLAYVETDDQLVFGYEDQPNGRQISGHVHANADVEITPGPIRHKGYAHVGIDIAALNSGRTLRADLYRSYDPLRGNRNIIDIAIEAPGGPAPQAVKIELRRPFLTDNFEGIAAEELADGRIRLWIISDDNFSPRQRTLLYAFEIDAPDIAAPGG